MVNSLWSAAAIVRGSIARQSRDDVNSVAYSRITHRCRFMTTTVRSALLARRLASPSKLSAPKLVPATASAAKSPRRTGVPTAATKRAAKRNQDDDEVTLKLGGSSVDQVYTAYSGVSEEIVQVQPSSISDEEIKEWERELSAKAVLIASFGKVLQQLRADIWSAPRREVQVKLDILVNTTSQLYDDTRQIRIAPHRRAELQVDSYGRAIRRVSRACQSIRRRRQQYMEAVAKEEQRLLVEHGQKMIVEQQHKWKQQAAPITDPTDPLLSKEESGNEQFDLLKQTFNLYNGRFLDIVKIHPEFRLKCLDPWQQTLMTRATQAELDGFKDNASSGLRVQADEFSRTMDDWKAQLLHARSLEPKVLGRAHRARGFLRKSLDLHGITWGDFDITEPLREQFEGLDLASIYLSELHDRFVASFEHWPDECRRIRDAIRTRVRAEERSMDREAAIACGATGLLAGIAICQDLQQSATAIYMSLWRIHTAEVRNSQYLTMRTYRDALETLGDRMPPGFYLAGQNLSQSLSGSLGIIYEATQAVMGMASRGTLDGHDMLDKRTLRDQAEKTLQEMRTKSYLVEVAVFGLGLPKSDASQLSAQARLVTRGAVRRQSRRDSQRIKLSQTRADETTFAMGPSLPTTTYSPDADSELISWDPMTNNHKTSVSLLNQDASKFDIQRNPARSSMSLNRRAIPSESYDAQGSSTSIFRNVDDSPEEPTQPENTGIPDDDNPYTPFKYQIPPDDLVKYSAEQHETGKQYWSYAWYKSLNNEAVNEAPKVQYCISKQLAEQNLRQHYLDKPVLGFDLEWRPNAKATEGIKNNISVVQLAADDRIAILHLARHKGETIDDIMPPTLKEIMESPEIIKAGVNIKADCTRLKNHLGIESQGIIELSNLHKLVTYALTEPKLINKTLVSLSKQTLIHLGFPMLKDSVRVSNWAAPLTHAQATYAACDAYAALRIFDVLEQKRKAMKPRQPRPEFAEKNLPIKFNPKEDAIEESSAEESSDDVEENDASSSAEDGSDSDVEYLGTQRVSPRGMLSRQMASMTLKDSSVRGVSASDSESDQDFSSQRDVQYPRLPTALPVCRPEHSSTLAAFGDDAAEARSMSSQYDTAEETILDTHKRQDVDQSNEDCKPVLSSEISGRKMTWTGVEPAHSLEAQAWAAVWQFTHHYKVGDLRSQQVLAVYYLWEHLTYWFDEAIQNTVKDNPSSTTGTPLKPREILSLLDETDLPCRRLPSLRQIYALEGGLVSPTEFPNLAVRFPRWKKWNQAVIKVPTQIKEARVWAEQFGTTNKSELSDDRAFGALVAYYLWEIHAYSMESAVSVVSAMVTKSCCVLGREDLLRLLNEMMLLPWRSWSDVERLFYRLDPKDQIIHPALAGKVERSRKDSENQERSYEKVDGGLTPGHADIWQDPHHDSTSPNAPTTPNTKSRDVTDQAGDQRLREARAWAINWQESHQYNLGNLLAEQRLTLYYFWDQSELPISEAAKTVRQKSGPRFPSVGPEGLLKILEDTDLPTRRVKDLWSNFAGRVEQMRLRYPALTQRFRSVENAMVVGRVDRVKALWAAVEGK